MKKSFIICVIITLLFMSICPPQGWAQTVSATGLMPQPGTQVQLSAPFTPASLWGMSVYPQDPFKFDFLVHKGDELLSAEVKQQEYARLIKYFLAALAIPDTDQWVNLSPYEKDRIIPDNFGLTEMGRDLLAQDYLLKQLAASLTDPDSALGKDFWDNVYAETQRLFGTTEVPTDVFNKVWIMPDKAVVYEKDNTVYVLESHLKVLTEQDYLAMRQNSLAAQSPAEASVADISSRMFKEVLVPAIEKEVNTALSFAPLRQIYSGMLLATWYKRTLKDTILGQVYADKGGVKGIDQDPAGNMVIYQQYLDAFRQGAVNFIKEDVDRLTREVLPKKYFSGGMVNTAAVIMRDGDNAQASLLLGTRLSQTEIVVARTEVGETYGQSGVVSGNTAFDRAQSAGFIDVKTRVQAALEEMKSSEVKARVLPALTSVFRDILTLYEVEIPQRRRDNRSNHDYLMKILSDVDEYFQREFHVSLVPHFVANLDDMTFLKITPDGFVFLGVPFTLATVETATSEFYDILPTHVESSYRIKPLFESEGVQAYISRLDNLQGFLDIVVNNGIETSEYVRFQEMLQAAFADRGDLDDPLSKLNDALKNSLLWHFGVEIDEDLIIAGELISNPDGSFSQGFYLGGVNIASLVYGQYETVDFDIVPVARALRDYIGLVKNNASQDQQAFALRLINKAKNMDVWLSSKKGAIEISHILSRLFSGVENPDIMLRFMEQFFSANHGMAMFRPGISSVEAGITLNRETQVVSWFGIELATLGGEYSEVNDQNIPDFIVKLREHLQTMFGVLTFPDREEDVQSRASLFIRHYIGSSDVISDIVQAAVAANQTDPGIILADLDRFLMDRYNVTLPNREATPDQVGISMKDNVLHILNLPVAKFESGTFSLLDNDGGWYPDRTKSMAFSLFHDALKEKIRSRYKLNKFGDLDYSQSAGVIDIQNRVRSALKKLDSPAVHDEVIRRLVEIFGKTLEGLESHDRISDLPLVFNTQAELLLAIENYFMQTLNISVLGRDHRTLDLDFVLTGNGFILLGVAFHKDTITAATESFLVNFKDYVARSYRVGVTPDSALRGIRAFNDRIKAMHSFIEKIKAVDSTISYRSEFERKLLASLALQPIKKSQALSFLSERLTSYINSAFGVNFGNLERLLRYGRTVDGEIRISLRNVLIGSYNIDSESITIDMPGLLEILSLLNDDVRVSTADGLAVVTQNVIEQARQVYYQMADRDTVALLGQTMLQIVNKSLAPEMMLLSMEQFLAQQFGIPFFPLNSLPEDVDMAWDDYALTLRWFGVDVVYPKGGAMNVKNINLFVERLRAYLKESYGLDDVFDRREEVTGRADMMKQMLLRDNGTVVRQVRNTFFPIVAGMGKEDLEGIKENLASVFLRQYGLTLFDVDNTPLQAGIKTKDNELLLYDIPIATLNHSGKFELLSREGDLLALAKKIIKHLQVRYNLLDDKDSAMRASQISQDDGIKGGIDLASANLDFQIRRDKQGMLLPLRQQNLDNIRIDGLAPVILEIKSAMVAPGALTQ